MTDSFELVICGKCCKLRWPGLRTHACTNFALLRISLRCFFHCFFWMCFSFEFAFCSLVFYCFLIKQSPNEWRWFCACLNYFIFAACFRCVVCISWSIFLMHILIFSIVRTIASLPYFLQRFCAVLVWNFGPNSSLLHFYLLHVFLGVTYWFFAILQLTFCFLVCSGLFACIY